MERDLRDQYPRRFPRNEPTLMRAHTLPKLGPKPHLVKDVGETRKFKECMELRRQFEKNGYAVIEELLFPQECTEMALTAYDIAGDLLKEWKANTNFHNKNQVELVDDYFLTSNDKIRPFVEAGALDETGNFKGNPMFSLDKIGHALHLRHPIFRCYTYCHRVRSKCKMLGLVNPAVVQSMIVFKNPGVSSEVEPHQDATFLFAEPIPTIGFWIALEDATVENGCLWIAAGSHKSGVHRRLIRNRKPNATCKLVFDKPNPTYPASCFKPVPVKKGSCIILHGHVVHKSGKNKTKSARPAYTFHMIEKHGNIYSPDNWLQEGPLAPFEDMYNVKHVMFDLESGPDSDNGEDAHAAHRKKKHGSKSRATRKPSNEAIYQPGNSKAPDALRKSSSPPNNQPGTSKAGAMGRPDYAKVEFDMSKTGAIRKQPTEPKYQSRSYSKEKSASPQNDQASAYAAGVKEVPPSVPKHQLGYKVRFE